MLGNRPLGSASFASFQTDVSGSASNVLDQFALYDPILLENGTTLIDEKGSPLIISSPTTVSVLVTGSASQNTGIFASSIGARNFVTAAPIVQIMPAFTASSSATGGSRAAASQLIDPLQNSAIASNPIGATGSQVIGSYIETSSGTVNIFASPSQTVSGYTETNIATVSNTAVVNQAILPFIVAISAGNPVTVSGNQTFAPFVETANAAVVNNALVIQSIASFTQNTGVNSLNTGTVSQNIGVFVGYNNALLDTNGQPLFDQNGETINSDDYSPGGLAIAPISASASQPMGNILSITFAPAHLSAAQIIDPISSVAFSNARATATGTPTVTQFSTTAYLTGSLGAAAAQVITAIQSSSSASTLDQLTGSSTVGPFTLTGSIQSVVSASGTAYSDSFASTATSTEIVSANAVQSFAKPASVGIGTTLSRLTGTSNVDPVTSTTVVQSIESITGTSSFVTFAQSASSNAVESITGTSIIGPIGSTSIGRIAISSVAVQTADLFTSSNFTQVVSTGAAADSFATFTQLATSTTAKLATSDQTIGPFFSYAVTLVTVSASTLETVDSVASNSSGVSISTATGTSSIASFAVVVSSQLIARATGANSLGNITAQAAANDFVSANASVNLDGFTATSSSSGIASTTAYNLVGPITGTSTSNAITILSGSPVVKTFDSTASGQIAITVIATSLVDSFSSLGYSSEIVTSSGAFTIGTFTSNATIIGSLYASGSTKVDPTTSVGLAQVFAQAISVQNVGAIDNAAASSTTVRAAQIGVFDHFTEVSAVSATINATGANTINAFNVAIHIDAYNRAIADALIDPLISTGASTTAIYSTVSQSFFTIGSRGRGIVTGNATNVSQTIGVFSEYAPTAALVKASVASTFDAFGSFTFTGGVISSTGASGIYNIASDAAAVVRVVGTAIETIETFTSDAYTYRPVAIGTAENTLAIAGTAIANAIGKSATANALDPFIAAATVRETITGNATQTIAPFVVAISGHVASVIANVASTASASNFVTGSIVSTISNATNQCFVSSIAKASPTTLIEAIQDLAQGSARVGATSTAVIGGFVSTGVSFDQANSSGSDTIAPFSSAVIGRVDNSAISTATISSINSAAQTFSKAAVAGAQTFVAPTSVSTAKVSVTAYDTSTIGPFTEKVVVSGSILGSASIRIFLAQSNGVVQSRISATAEQNSGYLLANIDADAVANASGFSKLATTSQGVCISAARLSGAITIDPFTSAATVYRKGSLSGVTKIAPVTQAASATTTVTITSTAAILLAPSNGITKSSVQATGNSTASAFVSVASPNASVSGVGQIVIDGASQQTNLDLIVRGRAQTTTFGPFESSAISPASIWGSGRHVLQTSIAAFGGVAIQATVENLLAPLSSAGYAGPYVYGTATNIVFDFGPRIVGSVSSAIKVPSYPFNMARPIGQTVLLKNQYDIPGGQAVCFILQVTDDPVKLRIMRMQPKFGQSFQDGSLRVWISKHPLGVIMADRAWQPRPETSIFVYPDTVITPSSAMNICIPQGDYYVNMLNMENRISTVMVFPSPHLISVSA